MTRTTTNQSPRINLNTLINPTGFLTIQGNQIVDYSGKVFLKDNTEFQIRLINPTSNSVLAKIKMNGQYISSSGIVLRPGEDMTLDRYIDTPNKFVFQTYKTIKELKHAIRNNGTIDIEFYNEYNLWNYWTTFTPKFSTINSWSTEGLYIDTSTFTFDDAQFTSSVGAGVTYENNTQTNGVNLNSIQANNTENNIETGRVEKAGYSNQEFQSVSMNFNSYFSWSISYQLFPISRQSELTSGDIRVYCTECGRKQKRGWKFCPSCGTKF